MTDRKSVPTISPRPLWESYSKKLRKKIDAPRFIGSFSFRQAEEKKMRLVTGKEGSVDKGYSLCLYWLVDEEDGVICDVKFQAYGPTALIGVAEVVSELVLRKNYDQASRIGADLIDQQVRDEKKKEAFPESCAFFLNVAIAAIDEATEKCRDIPFAATYEQTPVSLDFSTLTEGGVENWQDLKEQEKLEILKLVVAKEITPYVELDAGGVRIEELKGNEVIIAYEGACTSCYASVGSTLQAIQQILKARVYSELTVTPKI